MQVYKNFFLFKLYIVSLSHSVLVILVLVLGYGLVQFPITFDLQDDLDWTTRYVQNGCGNATFDWFNKTEDKYSYKFAVSIAAGNISGGMEWETLRFNGYQSGRH